MQVDIEFGSAAVSFTAGDSSVSIGDKEVAISTPHGRVTMSVPQWDAILSACAMATDYGEQVVELMEDKRDASSLFERSDRARAGLRRPQPLMGRIG